MSAGHYCAKLSLFKKIFHKIDEWAAFWSTNLYFPSYESQQLPDKICKTSHWSKTGYFAQLICRRKDRTAVTANFLALCHFLSSVQLMHYCAYPIPILLTLLFTTINSGILATSAFWHCFIFIPDIQVSICFGSLLPWIYISIKENAFYW